MRKAIFIIYLLFSQNIFALDLNILREKYPGFHDYEAISFVNLKFYFRNFYQNAVVYNDVDGIYKATVKDINGNIRKVIAVQISRKIINNKITEEVMYSFTNGKIFTYSLTRVGDNISKTPDLDLLTFNFHTNPNLEFYEFRLPSMNIIHQQEYYRSIDRVEELSFFSIGFMKLKLSIKSIATPHEVQRDYVYFYPEMNDPQKILSVNVKNIDSDWGSYEFNHILFGTGLITPGKFFDYLSQGNATFMQVSFAYNALLSDIGFPTF